MKKSKVDLGDVLHLAVSTSCPKRSHRHKWRFLHALGLRTGVGEDVVHYLVEQAWAMPGWRKRCVFRSDSHGTFTANSACNAAGRRRKLCQRTALRLEQVVPLLRTVNDVATCDLQTSEDGLSVLDACLARNNVSESVLGKHAKLSKYQDKRDLLWVWLVWRRRSAETLGLSCIMLRVTFLGAKRYFLGRTTRCVPLQRKACASLSLDRAFCSKRMCRAQSGETLAGQAWLGTWPTPPERAAKMVRASARKARDNWRAMQSDAELFDHGSARHETKRRWLFATASGCQQGTCRHRQGSAWMFG